ncbi:hypothetical protein SCOR_08305 [Sulfidibacter corallicola]|uniref:VCBS repeat-containing protein n=1 Tax=Sulfidibacter corallicola TaxID=2818388 RepID=A0A8A4TNW2_SULCO|nr:hypothetical protein [Sulfidibacter corallicola]QTD51240.1 hypothetical protein J3U87_02120 [Sulfidibacter corallicola]
MLGILLGCLMFTTQNAGAAPAPIDLPGSATPLALLAPEQPRWLVRQEDGGPSQLWRLDTGKPKPVQIPDEVLFLATSAEDSLLIAVFPDGIDRLDQEGIRQSRLHRFETPISSRHPWLPASRFHLEDRSWLVFFTARHFYAVELTGTGRVHRLARPTTSALSAGARQGEREYVQPALQRLGATIHWRDGDGYYRVDLSDGQPPHRTALPATKSMERVEPLPLPGTTDSHWFFFGGEQGSFDSFGWRLTDPSGNMLANGQGIVVKYGLDLSGAQPRFFVFTVSQRVRTQLWQALTGNTTFRCQVLGFASGTWKNLNRFSFKVSKDDDDPRRPVLVSWSTDWNGDGYADLTVSDAKRGLRFYASRRGPALNQRKTDLAEAPHGALFFHQNAWAARRTGSSWKLEPVK